MDASHSYFGEMSSSPPQGRRFALPSVGWQLRVLVWVNEAKFCSQLKWLPKWCSVQMKSVTQYKVTECLAAALAGSLPWEQDRQLPTTPKLGEQQPPIYCLPFGSWRGLADKFATSAKAEVMGKILEKPLRSCGTEQHGLCLSQSRAQQQL